MPRPTLPSLPLVLSVLAALVAVAAGALALGRPAAGTRRASTTPASASHDSHAPPGARGDWLPADEWVMSQWLPYDEGTLERLLGVTRADLDGWLDDRRPLAALAARHGFPDPARLADRLLATRRADHGATSLRTLRSRIMDTLTQPHLARHVLFHLYHSHALTLHTRWLFGVDAATFTRLRGRGLSPAAIARRGHVSVPALRDHLHAFFIARAADAVRTGAMSRAGAARLVREQDRALGAFVHRPYRTTAEQACYAAQHGHDHGHDSRHCGMAM